MKCGPVVGRILFFFLNPTGHDKGEISIGKNTDMGLLDNPVGVDVLQDSV